MGNGFAEDSGMVHRDQIHGDVRYDPMAVALLDTPAMQRLGRVYQLGFAHLVYRGGTHTRLSHVMGAAHVASRLVDALRRNYSPGRLPDGAVPPAEFLPGRADGDMGDRWTALGYLVHWAALLHDLGHVPLGHTLEDEFDGIYEKHDSFASPRISFLWHESEPGRPSDIYRVFHTESNIPECFRSIGMSSDAVWQTVMLICLHKENREKRETFADILKREESHPFAAVVRAALERNNHTGFHPYMADIVGNTICADYLDYLRRDPSNVGLDVLRDDRVVSCFYVGRDAQKQLRMALSLVNRKGKPRLDTCTGVVELVRQRFRFAEIIYYHKTKVAASAMLAKVFALIGKPPETRTGARELELSEVSAEVDALLAGKTSVQNLRDACTPAAMLDPEVGDEGLGALLMNTAWHKLEAAKKRKSRVEAAQALRGLALLQALARRRLYKLCFSVSARAYGHLTDGSREDREVELRLKNVLLPALRKDHDRRAELERRMAEAAGWPEDALLLYVPSRKVQAKGIETGALDRGQVVTLGEHSAVRAQVAQLSLAYADLWRLLVFVHPSYEADVLGLSKAVDALVEGLGPSANQEGDELLPTMRECSWFRYLPRDQRKAAGHYLALAKDEPRWEHFVDARRSTVDGSVTDHEHAERAFLLDLVEKRGEGADTIRSHYQEPSSLSKHLERLDAAISIEGREGMDEVGRRRALLAQIADELVAPQRPLPLAEP